MSWFSRIRVDASRLDHRAFSDLMRGDAYFEHALIWKLFPDSEDARDFVFRGERKEGGMPVYYVVSAREPQPVPGLLQVESRPYAPALAVGDTLRFNLRANPTVARVQENGKRSVRDDVMMHAKFRQPDNFTSEQMAAAMDRAGRDWLLKRCEEWGLEVISANFWLDNYRQHRLRHKGRNIEFSSVDYEGVAQVQQPEKLALALLQGVGRAKAFGCGLLLVRKV